MHSYIRILFEDYSNARLPPVLGSSRDSAQASINCILFLFFFSFLLLTSLCYIAVIYVERYKIWIIPCNSQSRLNLLESISREFLEFGRPDI